MDSIVSLPKQIVDWFNSQDDMSDLTFFVEYPPINKAVPLKKAIVAVGIESIDITDKFVDNEEGIPERQEYCRLAKIKANLSICVPFSKGGHTCHDIFTRITDALTFRTNLNITESGCSNINSDRDTDALVMNGWFLMNADFCPASSTDENFASFLDKELLCGSHIRNTDIHVTADDKNKWNEPYYAGFYMGTGNSSRSISLGYKPYLIIVANMGFAPTSIDFEKNTAKCNIGIATSSGGSAGIELTNTGFKLSSITIGGVTSSLNATGSTFMYIAFK